MGTSLPLPEIRFNTRFNWFCTCPGRLCAWSQRHPAPQPPPPRSSANVLCPVVALAFPEFSNLILTTALWGGDTFFFPFCRWETEALRNKVPCRLEVSPKKEGGCHLCPGVRRAHPGGGDVWGDPRVDRLSTGRGREVRREGRGQPGRKLYGQGPCD